MFTSPVKGSWSLPLSLNCSTSTAPVSLTMQLPLTGLTDEIYVTLNAPFATTFTAVGGTPPYTWTAAELPPGLTINASTGVVSGTATGPSPGSYSLITVRDSANPAQQFTVQYIFDVRP